MAIYLSNALSLGMLDDVETAGFATIYIIGMSSHEVAANLRCANEWESCVGHSDTALLFTSLLGVDVPLRRVTTSLRFGDVMYVGQYTGPRLPEGAVSLPEGAHVRWLCARVTASRPLEESNRDDVLRCAATLAAD